VRVKADVFISIHYNAFRGKWDETAGGKETHYLKLDSFRLAETIHKHLIKGTPQINRGVKKTNYYVLRNTNMPSILIEHGFMDVRKEAELMLNEKFQTEEAEQICQGVCEYFNVPYIGGDNMTQKEIIRACAVIIERLIKEEDIRLQAKYLRELFDKEGV
jgi:N-acetylmuramoyl-L-alanine amidase